MYNENLIVSVGEGDYRSLIMEFNVEESINLCHHDMQELNMNIYEYKFIVIKNDNIYIDKSFENIISNHIQKGGYINYYKKYNKYKKKYLNLIKEKNLFISKKDS